MTTLFISHSTKDKAWAAQTQKALSDSGYQCLFLDSHPDDGIPAGADWERTLYQRLRQSRGVVVLCSANWLASPWCVAEAMMARDRGKRVFLVAAADVADDRPVEGAGAEAPPRIPDFLKDGQLVSLGEMTEDEANQHLLQGLEKEGLKSTDFPLPGRPYPGLAAFQETDAAVYFGRDGEIDEVIAVLNRRRHNNARGFILVLGASGCGKSSLVRAGVLPRLRRSGGGDGARSAWVIVPPIMGRRGLDGLALSLAHAFKEAKQPRDFAALRDRLGAAGGLRAVGNELLNAQGAPDGAVLLVLDQLEEVFATADGSEPRALLGLLLDASAAAGSPIVVLATMRSDFLNAFQLFEGTAERYEKVTLDPMLRARFAEVIEGPADRFGLDLDPGLAERMATEAAYNDALPLLAFTLERLYEICKGERRLTLEAYGALGGVDGSVKHVADEILKGSGYAGLPADDVRMRDLRRAFYRLAQVGDEGQFTRRAARWSRMPDACQPLLQRFVEQRLLVTDTSNGERVLSVAHEALFRVWDTLNGWLRADRKALALRTQIEEAAAEWDAEERTESHSWSEERILDAVREIEMSGVSLDDVSDPKTVNAFLGPIERQQLESLPALDAADDSSAGSGRYGEAWRLPLSHTARVSAGVRLALLGDRRRGVGLREDGLPEIDWVPMDGGDVTIEIRANPDDPTSQIVNCVMRTVAPFWIARYPITVAQFRVFLEECYQNGHWLLPPGIPVEALSSYPPPRPRAHHGNHPVDGVNWWDARAFCHWLGSRLKYEVRLPTEYEWQMAATGGNSTQTYPWGRDWAPAKEPWRANTAESELGCSTAVGMYPTGASPAGLLDMAGTLWEWCLDPYETAESRSVSSSDRLASEALAKEDRRVLRGGAWIGYQNVAGSAYRFGRAPNNRLAFIGFRVVCSCPAALAKT